MSSNQTAISSVATKAQNFRALVDGISELAEELQDLATEKERRGKVRMLAANFLIFVNESMDEGHLQNFEDDLEFLESCMEIFAEMQEEKMQTEKPLQDANKNQGGWVFGKQEVLNVADEFKAFLSEAMDTEFSSGSEDAYDFIEGSFLEFLKSKNKLR